MRRWVVRVVTGLVFISSSSILTLKARAALGDKVDPSALQGPALSSTVSGVKILGKFSIKEVVSSQSTVREYVGTDGVVFGVAWSGRNHPNISELLGTFYKEYRELHQQRRLGSSTTGGLQMRGSRRTLRSSHVVVERFGHMGAIGGVRFYPH